MRHFNKVIALCCLAAIGPIAVPTAKADIWDSTTLVTFGDPVEIPGIRLVGWGILPAGTYVFKILDSQSDRHIVQIFSKDQKTLYATNLVIPNYRLKSSGNSTLTFSELPAGQPEALRAWFQPGKQWGEEFVYPKDKAIELARASGTRVLYTLADTPRSMGVPLEPAAVPLAAELLRAPVMAINPTGGEVELADALAALPPEIPAAATTLAAAIRRESVPPFPTTGSPVTLISLLGLLALGAAMILRVPAAKAASH